MTAEQLLQDHHNDKNYRHHKLRKNPNRHPQKLALEHEHLWIEEDTDNPTGGGGKNAKNS